MSTRKDKIHRLLRVEGWRVEVAYGLGEVERITREYFGVGN